MLSFSHVFDAPLEQVWSVVGTVDRVDWVPGVAACDLQAGVRTLNLPGAGEIQERIIERDEENYFLIESSGSNFVLVAFEHYESDLD